MQKRQIIKIDEEKCDGCGQCVSACAEGAIQIVDGKAKLISETYCDGLGACIGECPQGAISFEERDAEAFDSEAVKRRLAAEGRKLPCGCPSTMTQTLEPGKGAQTDAENQNMAAGPSQLGNWPVQICLVPVAVPYLQGARVLIAADCVPFALADFHQRLLAGRVVLVGCPKLDDADLYCEKLTEIFMQNDIQSVEVAYMEVPCCLGLVRLVSKALADCGKDIPLTTIKVATEGEILEMVSPKVGLQELLP